MRNTLVALAVAGALAGSAATPASAGYYYAPAYGPSYGYAQPYYGQPYYGRAYGYAPAPYVYRKRRNDVGKAIAIGIIGAAAAAIIASQYNKPRRVYRYR